MRYGVAAGGEPGAEAEDVGGELDSPGVVGCPCDGPATGLLAFDPPDSGRGERGVGADVESAGVD